MQSNMHVLHMSIRINTLLTHLLTTRVSKDRKTMLKKCTSILVLVLLAKHGVNNVPIVL